MLGWVLQPAIQYLCMAAKCFQFEHLESQLPLLANASTLPAALKNRPIPEVSFRTGEILFFKGRELNYINKNNISK